MRVSNAEAKVERRLQIGLLALFTLIFLWAILRATAFDALHAAAYTTADTAVPTASEKVPVDDLTITIIPEQEYLDSVELCFTDMPAELGGYIECSVLHNGTRVFSGRQPLEAITPDQWFSLRLGLAVEKNQQYQIHLTTTEAAGVPALYVDQKGTPAMAVYYRPNLRVADKVLVCALYAVIYFVVVFLLLEYKAVVRSIKKLFRNVSQTRAGLTAYPVINTLLAVGVLLGVQIKIEDGIFWVFIITVFFACGAWFSKWQPSFFKKELRSKMAKVMYVFLCAYASFALVGNRCFIYPLDMHTTIFGVLGFFVMAFCVAPCIAFALHAINAFSKNHTNPNGKNMPWGLYFLCFGIMCFAGVLYFRAFNPAISSRDTAYCMSYAIHSIEGMPNWHPPFYVLWLKAIFTVCNSIVAVFAVQYLWFSFVFMEGMRLLYRRGLPGGYVLLLTILSMLNCSNTVHLATVWKDIPYTISLLWLTVLIARLTLEKQNKKWLIYLELIVALICTGLMRQNGIVVFILAVLALIITQHKKVKVILSCVCSVVLVVLILGPLYTALNIQQPESIAGGKYVGLGQDILAVYYNDGALSEEAMDIVNGLCNEDVAGYNYNPYCYAYYSSDLDVSYGVFIRAYLNTFLRNPVVMLRSIVCRQDCVWNLFADENTFLNLVNYTGAFVSNGEEGAGYDQSMLDREQNYWTEQISAFTGKSVELSILNFFEWRAGIWTLLTVISFVVLVFLKGKKGQAILFVVQLGHILSLVLSTGWADYRYYWPVTLMGLFLILLVMTTGAAAPEPKPSAEPEDADDDDLLRREFVKA